MDHKKFISENKSMLIAPAGHGKTHSIIECLSHTDGKQLILTHTHAGIGSIREKIKKAGIKSSQFHIETISGFAQKYVHAYYLGCDMPDITESTYYSFILKKATSIISNPIIIKMLKTSYSGLFVDEYQDCTLTQHVFILKLNDLFPTRIFGDPLQGIFNFADPLVNLDDSSLMADFHSNRHTLLDPWRWKGINEPLGIALKEIRLELEAKKSIDFQKYPAIEFIQIAEEKNIYNPQEHYYKEFNKKISNENALIIHPDSSSINLRKSIIKNFRIPISLIESIDDKDFYSIAKDFDLVNETSFEQTIYSICRKLFPKTELENWIAETRVINKRKGNEKLISDKLSEKYHIAKTNKTFDKYAEVIEFIFQILKRCYRKELYNNICIALKEAHINNLSVHEAMIQKRNRVRKIGRKIYGKCIGTTLLTKGLEFETVIILNVNQFTCPKNFYVALTRASKRLIVFGVSKTINLNY